MIRFLVLFYSVKVDGIRTLEIRKDGGGSSERYWSRRRRCASAGGYQHELGCQEREENLALLTRDGIA